jgi:stage V sporulation protein G
MEITEVKVFPVQEEKLKAFASIVIDRCFMVNDIKVIQGKDGLFISMPSRRKKNGDFKDVAHPLNNETRRMMEERILSEYERAREARNGEAHVREAGVAAPERSEERPASPPPPVAPTSPGDEEAKSLDEVAEAHLRDSFWTV